MGAQVDSVKMTAVFCYTPHKFAMNVVHFFFRPPATRDDGLVRCDDRQIPQPVQCRDSSCGARQKAKLFYIVQDIHLPVNRPVAIKKHNVSPVHRPLFPLK